MAQHLEAGKRPLRPLAVVSPESWPLVDDTKCRQVKPTADKFIFVDETKDSSSGNCGKQRAVQGVRALNVGISESLSTFISFLSKSHIFQHF